MEHANGVTSIKCSQMLSVQADFLKLHNLGASILLDVLHLEKNNKTFAHGIFLWNFELCSAPGVLKLLSKKVTQLNW